MTLTLGIDTATDIAVVVIGDERGFVGETSLGRRRHASSLMPAVQELLRAAGASLADVGRIVLANGPGSFTGLRIGVATVQGIVHARPGIAVSSVPSLMVTARVGAAFVGDRPIAALYDALRGEVYGAVYAFPDSGRVDAIVPPILSTVAGLRERTQVAPALALGDGAAAFGAEVLAWTGCAPAPPPDGAPRGAALLWLDGAGVAAPVLDPAEFVPVYGRPAEAQVRWEERHGRPLPDSPGQLR